MPFSSESGKKYTDTVVSCLTLEHFKVLDVGPGSGTYSDRYSGNLLARPAVHWTGVEIWEPYVKKYDLRSKYDEVVITDALTYVTATQEKFDLILLGDVCEHMTKEMCLRLVKRCLEIATTVIISVPIIHYPQGEYDGNPYEAHIKDDWSHEEALASFPSVRKFSVENEIGIYVLKAKLKVCVYTICKSEEQFVSRFMKTCEGADGVYVLDTGSSDHTVKELRKHGAIVNVGIVSPWRFDVARNISMSFMPLDTDVCVCIDLDEVLTPGWRDEVDRYWQPNMTRLRYPYVWNTLPDGRDGITFNYEKFHSRTDHRWVKPVHEVLKFYGTQEIFGFTDTFTLFHYADTTKSRGSYLPLLEMGCQEEPNDDRNCHYLGREYMYYNMPDKAITELKRHLALPTATWEAERAASMRYLGRSYSKLGNNWEASRWFRRAVAESPNDREPWFELGQHLHTTMDHLGCYQALSEALKITTKGNSYICVPEAWGGTPWDLAAVSAFYLGLRVEAQRLGLEAARLEPQDARIQANLKFYTL